MSEPVTCPYGSWNSPITSDLIVAGTISLGDIAIAGENVYWVESRPAEGGRYVVVRCGNDGRTVDITPPPFNARTRAHEYGGGAYLLFGDKVYFSNFEDQRLYCQTPGQAPVAITPEANRRYADALMDQTRNRIICVSEDHSERVREAINTLVSISLDGVGAPQQLVGGNDFYSSPRLSPDGNRLAWMAWNHPNMPWDQSELWVGEIGTDGSIIKSAKVAGTTGESIFQPEWSRDGYLYFVSDRTGWWNLHRWRDGQTSAVTDLDAEFGTPQWVFGMATYGLVSADRIVCTFDRNGTWHLATIDTKTLKLEEVDCPYTEIRGVRAANGKVWFCGGSPTESLAIIQYDLESARFQVLRRSSKIEIDPEYLSIPESIEFPTEDGLTAFAFYYPPKSRDFRAPAGESPPLIVTSHGGPTSAAISVLSLGIQFWTSRGFGFLDVNYGGSSGYGRAYRLRLNGKWGVVDVDDCINGATYLAGRGDVDRNRLAIRGGSAGGYTTLAALTFRDVFEAGASYFGISDLEALEKDGHKFESRYSYSLVGPYPERRDLYIERSPIHFTDRLSCPIILFQGLEDKVVPPNQAEMMFEAVKAKGLPVAYVPFEGEQHGFRRAENIKRSLDAELYFYSKVFGFEPADKIEPVKIENLLE
ncbi:MAG TPA: S9 family peptidase [Blastocatellia bacterium]|nr:S9 family peptidase [Blastocatellia bacterium]